MFNVTKTQRKRICRGCPSPIPKKTVCIELFTYNYSQSFHIDCFEGIVKDRIRAARYIQEHPHK